MSEEETNALCRDFEDTVTKILLKKSSAAIKDCGAQTLIIGGGVSASSHLRQEFPKYFLEHHPDVTVYFPAPTLSTDNAIMIALSGHAKSTTALSPRGGVAIIADGNKSLA